MKRSHCFLVLVLFMAFTLSAQVKVTTSWTFDALPKQVEVGDEVELIFNVSIIKDWYIYTNEQKESVMAIPASALFETNDTYELMGDFYAVDPKSKYDNIWGDTVQYFKTSGQFRQTIKVLKPDLDIKGTLEFQTCSDVSGLCILYEEDLSFDMIEVGGGLEPGSNKEQSIKPDQVGVKKNVKPANSGESLWGFFLGAFLFGLAALLTPCVFPMIPMTVAFFTNDKQSKGQARTKALFYGVSIIAIYILIGLVFTSFFGVGLANDLATGAVPNIIFFVVFVLFAISFFGYFEINLPNGFINKMDRKAEKGGFLGVFFMAFTLVLVSFSCTGPIVGTVLIQSFQGEVIKPVIGMLGFSSAFAIPFTVFAFFPGLLKGLPKSGGWLNTVKVVLGFIELGLGFKFLSIADQAYHWGILDREIFIAVWFLLAIGLGLYLVGLIKFPHDDKNVQLSPGRVTLALGSFAFAVYLFGGFSGGKLNALAGYLPPIKQTDFSFEVLLGMKEPPERSEVAPENFDGIVKYADFLELPHDLKGFFDYDQAIEFARVEDKPLFIDFTGHGCVNCRKMEQNVWSDPRVLNLLKNEFVIVALYVDDKTELPEEEWYVSSFDDREKRTVGKQNFDFQIVRFNGNAQPYYIILDNDEQMLHEPVAYEPDADKFLVFLEESIQRYRATD
jgi:thiol:disulfide interchange protein